MTNNRFIVLLFFIVVISTSIWTDNFDGECPSRREEALYSTINWSIFTRQDAGIKSSLDADSPNYASCFTSDFFPNNVPSGLTFLQVFGTCVRHQITGLSVANYKLSFNYYEDPDGMTETEVLEIYIVDISTKTPITGGSTILNLRNQKYLYKKINFEISTSINAYIIFCDKSGQGITGITNVELADWPILPCIGQVQKEDMKSDPICVPTQIATDSINCFLYQLNGKPQYECGACDQLTTDTDLVDLNTPSKGCIQQSNINWDVHCSLYSHSTDFKCETCSYLTGESINSLKVFINGAPVYRCPSVPQFAQTHCTDYVYVGQYLSCKTCQYTLMPGVNNNKVCVKDIIFQCIVYKPDASCDPCASGIPSKGIICPSTAVSYMLFCLTANKVGNSYTCVACLIGYVLNFKNECLKMVNFCANYRFNVCTSCIPDYFFFEGNCFKPINQCKAYELNGRCKNCSEGYFVDKNNGTCMKEIVIICQSNQYINYGSCVDGNLPNCIKYESPSGDCLACEEGYRVTNQKRCQIICPNDINYERWTIRNGLCYMEDFRCKNAHPNGYCYECKDGFYAYYGKCYNINANVIENTRNDRNTV